MQSGKYNLNLFYYDNQKNTHQEWMCLFENGGLQKRRKKQSFQYRGHYEIKKKGLLTHNYALSQRFLSNSIHRESISCVSVSIFTLFVLHGYLIKLKKISCQPMLTGRITLSTLFQYATIKRFLLQLHIVIIEDIKIYDLDGGLLHLKTAIHLLELGCKHIGYPV